MSGKRGLASVCVFLLVFLAMRAAFHRPPPAPEESPLAELTAPLPALRSFVRTLFAPPSGGPGSPGGVPAGMPAAGGGFGGPSGSVHPPQRWTANPGSAGSFAGASAGGPGAAGYPGPARAGQSPPWQLPPASGGARPTAGGPAYPPRAPGAAGPAGTLPPPPRTAGGGTPPGGSARAAGSPSKTPAKGRAVAVAGAEPDAGAVFGSGMALPNARPRGAAGPGGPDPAALGPVRTMGAREGAPDRRSRKAEAEIAQASPDDAGSGGSSPDASGDSGGAAAAGSGDDSGGSGASPAAASPKSSKHHGHGHHGSAPGGAAPADPSSGDASSGGQAPADPSVPPPPAAPPSADPSAPGAKPPDDGDDDQPDRGEPGTPGRHHREIAQVTPVVGAPVLLNAQPTGIKFAATPGGAATVQTAVVQTPTAQAVAFTTRLGIDPNGAGGWYHADESAQPETALRYPDGRSLNPGKIPYVAIPENFASVQPGVKLGDYAAVAYGGKTVYAIVGDYGPAGVVGGGSMVLASGLGINPDPKEGGVGAGVSYTILGGSGGAAIPADAAGVEAAGKTAFEKAGIPVR